jgi:hypothetical protein
LGASIIIDEQHWYCLGSEVDFKEGRYAPEAAEELHRFELMVRFRRVDPDGKQSNCEGLGPVLRDMTFLLDGESYLEFADSAEIKINLHHSLLFGLNLPSKCSRAAELHPHRMVMKEGWLHLRGDVTLDERKQLNIQHFLMAWLWGDDGFDEQDHASPEMQSALNDFARVFNTLVKNACSCAGEALRPYVVPASRRVPEPCELTFLISHPSQGRVKSTQTIPIVTAGDPAYRSLACCFAYRALGGESFGDELKVNRMLTGALFAERGYQLVADCRIMVTPEQFRTGCFSSKDSNFEPVAMRDLPVLVTMHLQDAQGRSHNFTQVGSGLGYVLPVLAALSDPVLKLIVLQQPELHLHPALQAALGDVFVEFSRRPPFGDTRMLPRFLIETHSEHLLLRVLKRLRQTGAEKCIDPDLQIRPDDVSILYFDPKPDGTTKVKQLRVAPDGEFMDRWPRGFFTERYEELFDE